MLAWRVAGRLTAGDARRRRGGSSALWLALLALAAVGLLALLAWLTARTTVYTITSRRVVMRFGVALPMTHQPARSASIDVRGPQAARDGTGDMPLALTGAGRIAYLHAVAACPALAPRPARADAARRAGRRPRRRAPGAGAGGGAPATQRRAGRAPRPATPRRARPPRRGREPDGRCVDERRPGTSTGPFPRGAAARARPALIGLLAARGRGRAPAAGVRHAPCRPRRRAQSRDLRFEDRADGAVAVLDGRGRRHVVAVLRARHQRLHPRRRCAAWPATASCATSGRSSPSASRRWDDGRLTLEDPATGGRIELEAFGPTNAGAFARLLTAGRATP